MNIFRKDRGLILLMVLAGLFSFTSLRSQQFSFSHLSSEEGLSNNLVQNIIQDKNGYIWIGTQDGLNRFDGYSIKVYRNIPEDTASLLDNFILSLFRDHNGDLWVGTLNGMCRYNYDTDDFTRFPVSTAEVQGFKKFPMGSIAEDKDGNIWYGNRNGGVYVLRRSNYKYIYYDYPAKSISKIFVDKDNNIIVGTLDGEVYYFENSSNRFSLAVIPGDPSEKIPDNYVRTIFQSDNGKLMVSTSQGIFVMDPTGAVSENVSLLPKGLAGFRNNEIRYVYEEKPGLFWIATWGKGLYRCDSERNLTQNFQVEPGNDNSLSNNDVNVIYKDRSGVIWVGTQEGLTLIDPAKELFRKYQNDPKDPASLHFNFITSFTEDRHGMIWIGTYGGGLSIFNPKTETFRKIMHAPDEPASLSNNAIRAICEDPEGKIWVGTMQGLDVYEPATGCFRHYEHFRENQNIVKDNDVLCIINGNHHDLWVGTFGGGIIRVILPRQNGEEPGFVSYISRPGDSISLSSNYIRSLRIDRQDRLWIGNLGSGLDVMDTKTGETRHFSADGLPGYTLSNNNINCIKIGRRGYVWLGTWNGVSRLDPKNGRVVNYTVDEGLPDGNVSEIQQDDSGSIWVSTFKGIVRLTSDDSGENIKIVRYTTRNGLQGNKFNINASLKTRNGNIYFGGTTGFNVIDPSGIISNDYVPPVVLTRLQVFNEPVGIKEKVNGHVVLKHSLTSTDRITLSHKDKIFSIEFAALSYSENERNVYKYFLEGVDKQWVTVDSKRRFATYSNLPQGEYTFRVKAANSDGIWNEKGRTLTIKVLPSPWKSWWAFLIYGIVVFTGLLWLRYDTFKRTSLQHQLEMEAFERKKDEEVNQMKFSFFTNISHEVRTPLTLIMGPLEKLLKDNEIPGHAQDHLKIMNKNAGRLLKLINQLLDFRKIELGKLALEFSETDIVEFIREIKGSFDDYARQSSIDYTFTSPVSAEKIWIDSNKFEMVLFNILSNAFKFTGDQGKIHIALDSTRKSKPQGLLKKYLERDAGGVPEGTDLSNYTMISVSDTGTGIPKYVLPKIFDRFFQVSSSHRVRYNINQTSTGIGLSIARDIVQLHNGHIFVRSIYGKGSTFYIFIPAGDEHIPVNQKIKETETLVASQTNIIPELTGEDEENRYVKYEEDMEHEMSSQKLKILVIEDDEDMRKFVAGTLSEKYIVLEAADGSEGLEIALKQIPDLIISDISMAVMDGHEFTSKLKKDIRISHIPVILLTAYDTENNQKQGYDEGADEYITKPFNINLLLSRISNLIESRMRLRESFSRDPILSTPKVSITSVDSQFLEKAVRIVEERMNDPEFNVVTFGEELCMSRTNLFRKMKSLTNQSASEFIRMVKIKNAARLLLSGYNISQVMDMVGISSRSYFSKCFQEHFSKTPSEYIKEYFS